MTDNRKTLTDTDEQEIIAAKAADPNLANTKLAATYGVHPATIKRLLDRNKPKGTPGAAGIQDIPHNKISPSPLNPRKTFDPEALAETAASMRAEAQAGGGAGVLQNLVVRPKDDGTYEIVAGERRWRAVGENIKAEVYGADIALPCRIRSCSDAMLVELALLENIDRQDMLPLEEANAFQQLFELQLAENADLTQRQFAIATADNIGKSQRYVELRLSLATKLCDTAKKALSDGDISPAAARILAQHDHEHQEHGICLMTEGWDPISTAKELAEELASIYPDIEDAKFDLADYNGDFIEPSDGDDIRRFKDIAQFKELQIKAAKELVTHHEADGATFVYLSDDNDPETEPWHLKHTYGDSHSKGVIITIDLKGCIRVLTGLMARTGNKASASSTSAPSTPAKPKEPGTIGHREHARRRKSVALQNAVAADPRTAKVLACLALVGGQKAVKIKADNLESPDSTIEAISPDVKTTLKTFGKSLGIEDGSDERRPLYTNYGVGDDDDFKHYNAIKALPDDELDKLFAYLVARQVGSFSGYQPGYGDCPTVVQLAEDLGLSSAEASHGLRIEKDDLAGLSKSALETVCTEIGIDPERTMKATATAIEDNAPEDYVLPSLHFGERDRVKASMLNPTTPLVAAMTKDTECVNTTPAE